MAESRNRHLESIVEKSQYWDAEDLLRSLEEEMRRMEQGLGHMIWDEDYRPVTMWPNPLPVTPKFEESIVADEFRVKVFLPGVSEDSIEVGVERDSIEVFARHGERICRPFMAIIDAPTALDPESARAEFHEGVLDITVRELKRHKVKVK